MRLFSLVHRRSGPGMPFRRRELDCLRRWLQTAATARLSATPTTPSTNVGHPGLVERRETARRTLALAAEVRPISAGAIGLIRRAAVHDVSPEGIALRVAEPLPIGQRLSLNIVPPSPPRGQRFARADRPVQLLAVVRYCRAEGAAYVLGCSIGVEWADSLANQMFPADLQALRRSA